MTDERDYLAAHHERHSLILLRALAAIVLLLAPFYFAHGRLQMFGLVTGVVLGGLVLLAVLRPPAHRWRVVILVAVPLVVGVLTMNRYGLLGESRACLLIAAMVAMRFHRATGYAIGALAVAATTTYHWALQSGQIEAIPALGLPSVPLLATISLLMNGALLGAAHYLSANTERSLLASRRAESRLQSDNVMLEQRVAERTRALHTANEALEHRLEVLPAAVFVSDWTAMRAELEALRDQGQLDSLRDEPGLTERLLGMRRNRWSNRRLLDLYGLDDSEALMAHVILHPPSDHEIFHAAELLESGHCTFRSREMHRDGSIVVVDWTVTVPDGDWSKVTGVGLDMTREALYADWMDLTLSQVGEGISMMDADLNMLVCNDRFYELLDFPRELLPPGTNLVEFFRYNAARGEYGPGDPEAQVAERIALARRGEEHQFTRKRGDRILLVTGRVLPDGGFVTAYTDITDRERAREDAELDSARKRQTLELIRDGVLRIDADLNVVLGNDRVCALLGLPPGSIQAGVGLAELLGAAPAALYDPGELEITVRRLLVKALQHATASERVWRRDGRCIELEAAVDPVLGRVLVLSDVTAEIRLQEQLHERVDAAEKRFERLLDASEVIFLALDGEGRVVEGNAAAERLLDAPRDGEARLDAYLAGARPLDGEALLAHLDAVCAGAVPQPVEVVYPAPDQSEQVVLFTLSTLGEPGEPPTEVLLVGTDVSSMRDAERRLVHAAKLVSLGEMATEIAHEINQPLNVIRLALGNIERRLNAPDRESNMAGVMEKIDRIQRQVSRAAKITDNLRRFGRTPSGDSEQLVVSTVIDGTLEMVGEQLRLADIELRLEVDTAAEVQFDRIKLEQVLLNLVTNARHAILEAEPAQRWIALSCRCEGGRAVITVGDSGGGIPESGLERVFESYFTTKPDGHGTGLGLAISRKLVEEGSGTMVAGNGPDGAIFTVSLPLAG